MLVSSLRVSRTLKSDADELTNAADAADIITSLSVEIEGQLYTSYGVLVEAQGVATAVTDFFSTGNGSAIRRLKILMF